MPPYYSREGLYEDLHAILYSGGFLRRFACHCTWKGLDVNLHAIIYSCEGLYEDLHVIVPGRVLTKICMPPYYSHEGLY